MNDDNYRLRPSAAARWMNCPGSVALEHDTGDEDETGPAASEGQAGHAVAARALVTGSPLAKYLHHEQFDDEQKRSYRILPDWIDWLGEYVDAVRERSSVAGTQTWIEKRLDLPRPVPGWTIDNATGEIVQTPKMLGGTADAIVWDPATKRLDVFDLKFGRNVLVEAWGNPQLWIYALLAVTVLKLCPELIVLHIIQPRAPHDEGSHRIQTIQGDDLLAFDIDVYHAVGRAGAPGAQLIVSDDGHGWCRFCSAREECPARMVQAVETSHKLAETVPGVAPMWPEPLPPEQLDTVTLARVLPWLDIMDRWSKDARAVALERSEAEAIPGYKRIAGRNKRLWREGTDVAVVDEVLADDVTLEDVVTTRPAELLSVAQLEKELGRKKFKQLFSEHVVVQPGNPRLVPETAQGRELGVSAENDFDAE